MPQYFTPIAPKKVTAEKICILSLHFSFVFLKAVQVLFTPMVSGWVSWWAAGKVYLIGCISETMRCRKLTLCKDIGWLRVGVMSRCTMSWCYLDLTL